jgi:hypothetical protein
MVLDYGVTIQPVSPCEKPAHSMLPDLAYPDSLPALSFHFPLYGPFFGFCTLSQGFIFLFFNCPQLSLVVNTLKKIAFKKKKKESECHILELLWIPSIFVAL